MLPLDSENSKRQRFRQEHLAHPLMENVRDVIRRRRSLAGFYCEGERLAGNVRLAFWGLSKS